MSSRSLDGWRVEALCDSPLFSPLLTVLLTQKPKYPRGSFLKHGGLFAKTKREQGHEEASKGDRCQMSPAARGQEQLMQTAVMMMMSSREGEGNGSKADGYD